MPVETPQTGTLALRDIHLPEPVSWWPPAPGWWILAGLLLVVIIAVYLLHKFKQRKLLQKSALAELESIREQFNKDLNAYALVQSLSVLMRRSCISFYPRANSASLTGEQWLDYLDKTSSQGEFKHSSGKILATAPYLPRNHRLDIDADALLSLCENWIQAQPVKNLNTNGART